MITGPNGKTIEGDGNSSWPQICAALGIYTGWFKFENEFSFFWAMTINGTNTHAFVRPNDPERSGIYDENNNFEAIPGLTKEEVNRRLKLQSFA